MSHLGAEEGVVALLEGEASRGADLAVLPERVARDGRAGGALHVLEQQHRRLPEQRRVGAGGHAEVEPLVRYAPHPAPAQRVHRLVRAHLRRNHEVVRAQHRCSRPRSAGASRTRALLARSLCDVFRACYGSRRLVGILLPSGAISPETCSAARASLAMPRAAGGDRMPRRRHAWCVAGLVWAAAALVAAVPVPDEEVLASLLDGDEQQTAGEWVLACADTCVPGLRAVRTGPRVPASCVLHVLEAQGSLPRGRHHAVRAPASGVLYVPRTVA